MKKFNLNSMKIFALAAFLTFLSPLASSFPDGLEWCADYLGFGEKALPVRFAPIGEYSLAFITNSYLRTSLAGLLGVMIIMGVFYLPRFIKRTH